MFLPILGEIKDRKLHQGQLGGELTLDGDQKGYQS